MRVTSYGLRVATMLKDRLISESCDFGVVYSLYARAGKSGRRAIIKASWEEPGADGDPLTRSCVFELNFKLERLIALGRKGNQLPADNFPGKRICAWALPEWLEFVSS